MSYCRWSSDDFKSDIYAYQSQQGYVIHVACNRIVGDLPIGPDWSWIGKGPAPEGWAQESAAREKARSAYLDTCERVDIDHVLAGATFHCPDLDEFKAQLEVLQAAGFRVPDYVFETIREEIEEEGASQ